MLPDMDGIYYKVPTLYSSHSYEKEYNTGHGIQTIPNKICGKILGQPEVQQVPILMSTSGELTGMEI